jgi:hypothetical protein
MITRLRLLANCAICGKGIYSVDESSYFFVTDEALQRYTSDRTTILKLNEDLDGHHVHTDCLPDPELCIDNEEGDESQADPSEG